MPDYIEREVAIKELMNDAPEQVGYSREDAADCIRYMDAADVAPVRRGNWSLRCETHRDCVTGEVDEDYYLECSECKRKVFDISQDAVITGRWADVIRDFPYCHCGALMDGGTRNEQS